MTLLMKQNWNVKMKRTVRQFMTCFVMEEVAFVLAMPSRLSSKHIQREWIVFIESQELYDLNNTAIAVILENSLKIF